MKSRLLFHHAPTRLSAAYTIARRYASSAATSPTHHRIGFIGLGQMGKHMAANLFKKTLPSTTHFVVSDVMPAAASQLASHLATIKSNNKSPEIHVAKTPREVAEQCDAIFTMLPSSPEVKHVYLDKKTGVLSGLRQSTILVDCSTIDVAAWKDVSAQLLKNTKFVKTAVDAPVSGGVLGAEAGTLTFMVGTPKPDDLSLVQPYLQAMGKNVFHCGSSGTGQVAKICNNMLLGISMIATSEAMHLGMRLGMDPKLLASIINVSSGRCWSSDTYNPVPGVMPNVPSSRNYTGGFGVKLIAKDLGLAMKAASDTKSTAVLGSVAHQVYNQLSTSQARDGSEYGQADFSSVFKWLDDNDVKFAKKK